MKGIKRIMAGVLLAAVAVAAHAGYVMDPSDAAAAAPSAPMSPIAAQVLAAMKAKQGADAPAQAASACVAPNCPPIVVDESAVAKDPNAIKWSWGDSAANPASGKWYVRNDALGKCESMSTAKVRALDIEWDSKGTLTGHHRHYVSNAPAITILRGDADPVNAYADGKDCYGDMKLGAQSYRRAVDGVVAQNSAPVKAPREYTTRRRPAADWQWGDAASTPENGMWYVAEHDVGRCLPMETDTVRAGEAYWKELGHDSLRGYGPSGFAAIVITQGGNNRMAAYASGADCALSIANGW